MGDSQVKRMTEVFQCYICMSEVQDARLCPYCSKLCCYRCITQWLDQGGQQCPHCRAMLQVQDLVNCRWVEEVTEQLGAMSAPSPSAPALEHMTEMEDMCETHREKLSVYCQTCKSCICHQCALWTGTRYTPLFHPPKGNFLHKLFWLDENIGVATLGLTDFTDNEYDFYHQHRKHKFKPLRDVYDQHVSQIREKKSAIGRQLDVERNVDSVTNAKEERVREIRNTVEMMIARLDSQVQSKLITLMGQKNQLSQETEMLQSVLQQVDHQMQTISKCELILRTEEMLQIFSAMQTNTSVTAPVSPDFSSELFPNYETSTFTLSNFSQLRQRADPVYSNALNVFGFSWRLKIYPDGDGAVRGRYLSVFLELSAGISKTSKYEYRIEMVHLASGDPTKNIIKEFASEFDVGVCQGCDRFFRLDKLVRDGYLDPAFDTLVLNFQVRAQTFHQKCQDLQLYTQHLEQQVTQYQAQVNSLNQPIVTEMSRSSRQISARNVAQAPMFEMEEERDEVHGLTITVSDPWKKGDGMNAYMTYKVRTKTTMSMFRRPEFAVYRRFSDFLGLHEKLVAKHRHAGRIVPPVPEKSVVGMTRVKMSKTEEEVQQINFIERRRAALERYLNRVARHKVLVRDRDFRDFLEQDDLPEATSTRALSSAGVMRLMKDVMGAISKITIKITEDDAWFEEKTQQVDSLDQKLRTLHHEMEDLVRHRKALAVNTASIAKSAATLGNVREHTALSRAFAHLSEAFKNVEGRHQEVADSNFYNVSEVIGDYIRIIGEIKAKLQQQGRTDRSQIVQLEITELEDCAKTCKKEFDDLSSTLKKEIIKFEQNRVLDFKQIRI